MNASLIPGNERCDTCGVMVSHAGDHEPGCADAGIDADGLRERRESWDREFRYDGYVDAGGRA